MKFQMVVDVDTETSSPDAVGEFLRQTFGPVGERVKFRQRRYEYWCYTTFDVNPGVMELPSRPTTLEESGDDRLAWQRWKWKDIIAECYWDGDGVLQFVFPDGKILRNGDCKQDYGWEWMNEE